MKFRNFLAQGFVHKRLGGCLSPLSAARGAHGNPLSVDFGADVLFYVSIGFLLVRHVASLRGVNLTSVIALATEGSTS